MEMCGLENARNQRPENFRADGNNIMAVMALDFVEL